MNREFHLWMDDHFLFEAETMTAPSTGQKQQTSIPLLLQMQSTNKVLQLFMYIASYTFY